VDEDAFDWKAMLRIRLALRQLYWRGQLKEKPVSAVFAVRGGDLLTFTQN
jgi:hypothetical protein